VTTDTQIYGQNSKLTVLGAWFPHFCPGKREIWQISRLLGQRVAPYQGNVSPLRGDKPIFGLLSKNNTGMAVLRAGLLVKTSHFFVYSRRATHDPHHTWHRDRPVPFLHPVNFF